MRKFLNLLAAFLILAGCVSEREYKEIRDLRMGGQLADSRNLALSVLQESPKNLSVWRELSRTDLEYAKKVRIDKSENPMAALAEGSLICAAMYQYKKQKPDVRWKQASLLAYAEVNAQLNILAARMNEEAKLGVYLNTIMEDKSSLGNERSREAATEKVETARNGARGFIKDVGVALALSELLPETNGGTTRIMSNQIKDLYQKWTEALGLDRQTMDELQQRANASVKSAAKTIEEDLSISGHFQIQSVTENGIY